jgi:hypothetical protein
LGNTHAFTRKVPMCALITILIALGLPLLFPERGLAAEGYLTFSPQVSNNAILAGVGVVVAVVVVIALTQIYSRMARKRQRAPAKGAQKKKGGDFKKQAAKLGFKIAEIKTMRILAAKIAPQDPDSVLSTDAGRERLSADVWERISKREREVKLLQGIQDKLKLMRDNQLHERATVRVETDLAVWIVKKADVEEDVEDMEEVEEELFTDVEQVSGKLMDLSEGGAAVIVELEAGTDDLVELWSADADIWIPPITAGVLNVQRGRGGKPPIFHLHFIDPPLVELRAAIQTLQRTSGMRMA